MHFTFPDSKRLRQAARTHAKGGVLAGAMLLVGLLTFLVGTRITLTADCMLSKMALDEVVYQRAYTSQHVITNLADVLKNTYYLYFDWTGRYTTTFFLYLFGILPELVFAAANAAFFVATAWMLAAVAKACRAPQLAGSAQGAPAPLRPGDALPAGGTPRDKLTLADSAVFALCAMLLWLIPDPGQILMWKTGAIVYLHPLAYSLPFLLLHIAAFCGRGGAPKRGAGYGAAMLVYGLLVGATVEHLSLTLLFGCGALLAVRVVFGITRLRDALLSWECASLAGAAAGSVIMLVAPGNLARQEGVYFNPVAKLSILDTRAVFAHFEAIYSTGYFFFVLVVLGALLFAAALCGKKSVPALAWSGFFVVLANVSLLALYFSPYQADRTYCIAYYFYLLAIAVPAWFLLACASRPLVHWGVLGAALCVTVLALVTPYRQLAGNQNAVRANNAIIAQAKADGENVMVVSVRDEDTPFNPYARYLHDSFEEGANRSYATLHGIDLVVSGTDTDTFRFDAATNENELPRPVAFDTRVVLDGVYTRQNAESLFVLLTFNEDLDTQLLYQNRKRQNELVLTAELETDDGPQTVRQTVYPGYRLQNNKNVVYTNLVLPGKVTVKQLTVELLDPRTGESFPARAQILR